MDHRRFIVLTGVFAAAVAIGGPAAASSAPATATSGSAAVSPSHRGGWDEQHYDYYLALGDSLAAGVQPDAQGRSLPTDQGYAMDLAAYLRRHNRHLDFVDLGCPGETTTTMLNGGCPFPHDYGNQVDAAASFLAAHPHARILVTIDIGANNVDGCATATGIDATCVGAGLRSAAADMPEILGKLKAAAGRHVRFAAMNYYDPFLAAWLAGPAGQAEATGSVQLSEQFNGLLEGAYRAFGVPVADVSGRFDTTLFTPLVQLTPTVQVPLNVARICQWTWMCAPAPQGPNIHANKAGYEEIADTFEAIVGRR
ncbi:SGNH/GDSL hydrolase family protein [Actinocrinis puniceicyclus]|uniref:SGNH/GDSL hydrolase family protein n=1 Tax=Actinocrinis puniceicyclus TaxID=977794 RepID=A0A8J8BEG9_9ACTN|nr:SGNH/GDSL hydrolase family protein [Actinocrinis puniceicyclus]MBS2965181.1 SGNH/GDSL hydrolase family protein [Actinocrinis puniceicyclus]